MNDVRFGSWIAVEMPKLGTPRTDPDKPDSSIRLLPRVFDGEAPVGPGMKDARRGKPAGDQLRHPVPRAYKRDAR